MNVAQFQQQCVQAMQKACEKGRTEIVLKAASFSSDILKSTEKIMGDVSLETLLQLRQKYPVFFRLMPKVMQEINALELRNARKLLGY